MEELTIEQKAERYDEAIKKAKEYYNKGKVPEFCNHIASDIFPELKGEQIEIINCKKVFNIELPKEIQIGGQILTTQMCEELGGKLGRCCCYNGYIKIATNIDGCAQTDSSMLNTYIHECVHAILDTMGREDLSGDEKFVSTFASFATEGIVSILKQK